MSDEDRNAAIELAIAEMDSKFNKTVEKLEKEWGSGLKRTTREQQSLVFAKALTLCGGTFELTKANLDFGYETIWQAMAGELHDKSAKSMQKASNATEFASMYKYGCTALNDKMVELWDNQVVYCIPRKVNGGRIDVVTTHANFVVNEDGQTAHEVWIARGNSRVEGQVDSVMKKLARATSNEQAAETLTTVLARSIQKLPTLVKRGRLEHKDAPPDFLS